MLYVGTQTSAEKKRKRKFFATHILPNKTNQTPFLRRFLTKRGIKDMCFSRHTQIAAKNFLPHKNFYPSGSFLDEASSIVRQKCFIVA
jgi:hypothetical protein